MGRLKNILLNASLALVSLFLSFLAGEAALRYLPLGVPAAVKNPVGLNAHMDAMQADGDLQAALKPGMKGQVFVTADYAEFHVDTEAPKGGAAGFREHFDAETVFGVAVGDSFIFGWGQEYPDTLVKGVEGATGRRFFNFGVSGQGPAQYNLILEKYAAHFKPKVALWGFFPNDFSDAHKFEEWKKGSQGVVGRSAGKLNLWFTRHSAVYKLYKFVTRPYSTKIIHYKKGDVDYAFERNWFGEVDPRRSEIMEGAELVKREMSKLKGLGERHGFTPVVVAFPEKEQVYFPEMAETAGPLPYNRADCGKLYAETIAYAEKLGLRVVDLEPALEKEKSKQIYFKIDGHFTKTGAAIAGNAVAAYLANEGLLTTP